MKNKSLLLALATAVVLGACGNEDAKTTEEVNTEDTQVTESADSVKEVAGEDKADDEADDKENTTQTDKDPIPATEKTLEEAFDAFYDHFQEEAIELTGAGLDEEDGKYVYSVTGYKDGEEFEAEFDADSLDLIKEERDTEDDSTVLAIERDGIITAKEAMEKALEGQEGAWVKEYELEAEDGKALYEIDIEDGNDVKVGAASGEIL
ncbi:PepSY domain-containing protein [uncultured Anaerococcus sp.]|uniref:PepSY domain-containing protein n=1 Tax=uncultured Anaerococcus sp. TaxID=293428 RepID=UPI0025E2D0E2|nr:PepSY domain-containing protein [uncultured Anaerococcus sp.]